RARTGPRARHRGAANAGAPASRAASPHSIVDGMANDLRMNERAWALADAAAERAQELRVDVSTLASGARVIDDGIGAAGGLGAGRLLAQWCMGGLGEIECVSQTIGDETWPGVQVWTDHPAESCMASQYAGWAISPEGY